MTATSTTAQEMVNRLRDNHPGPQELVDRIFQECLTLDRAGGRLGADSGDEALLHQKGSPLGRARAFATLCRAAKIPARLVTGFEIKKGKQCPAANVGRSLSPIRSRLGALRSGERLRCRSWTTTSSPCGATAWT